MSRRHGAVSRQIFQPLFPRWPEHEVPVGHITNGVHVPTWDSQAADEIWTDACGKDRWRCIPDNMRAEVAKLSDDTLWAMRGKARQDLMLSVRGWLRRQLAARGNPPETVVLADSVLDPNVLTLGFARRFTAYKRPNLLLRDRDRIVRLLSDQHRPVQFVLAGKAHPADTEGKQMIQEWCALAQTPALRNHVVFNAAGVPCAWLARIRRSMAELTPQFSSTRMVREYLENAYLPAAQALKQRMANNAEEAKAMLAWEERVRHNWKSVHIGTPAVSADRDTWGYTVPVYLGEMDPDDIQLELCADTMPGDDAPTHELSRGTRIPGTANGYLYRGRVPASHPADHYTVRAVPHHPDVRVPAELPMIL